MDNNQDRIVRAYLEVVKMVVLFVRVRSGGKDRLSDEHLFDLMDAIHNVPEFLSGRNAWFTDERMREMYFGSYDKRWSERGGLHLVTILDEALTQG